MATAVGGWSGEPGVVLAIPFGMLCGLVIGLVNGLGVAYLRMPSMIFTLGINAVVQGLMVAAHRRLRAAGPRDRRSCTCWPSAHDPRHSQRALRLAASSASSWSSCCGAPPSAATSMPSATARRAAYLSGVNTRAVLIGCFALCGVCAALAGVLLAGYSTKAYQAHGRPLPAAGDRRGRARRHQHPGRPRQLSRHRRRASS